MTTKAIVELVRFLLKLFLKQYVLTKRLNQDPLEAFLSNIRRVGGTNEAPDVARYAQYQRLIAFKKDFFFRADVTAELKISKENILITTICCFS